MSYVLGQIDPTPPPVRPPNWPVIIGWVGLVGASLAILNGTLSLHGMRANRRRRSTRKNRRRLSRHMRRNSGLEQFDFSGDPSGRKFIIRVAARDMFDAVGKLKEELKNLDYDTAAQMEGWPTKLSAYQLLRTSGRGRMAANPRYRMWTGPMYPRQVADAIRKAGGRDVIAGTEHVIFRTDDFDALKARAGIAKPFLTFRGVQMTANARRSSRRMRRNAESGMWVVATGPHKQNFKTSSGATTRSPWEAAGYSSKAKALAEAARVGGFAGHWSKKSDGFSLDFDAALTTRNTGRRSSRSATLGWTDPLGFPGYAHQADNARSLGVRPLTKAEYKAEVIRLRGRRHWDTGVVDQLARRHREHTGKKLGENAGRRPSPSFPAKGSLWMATDGSLVIVTSSGRSEVSYRRFKPTRFQHDDTYSIAARAWATNFKPAVTPNAGRRSSHARPKSPKFSEMAIWESVARVRESGRPSEVAGVLPPGVATKFKHLAPGLYKYGYGPKKGEVIVQFKNASLKGALTSTRIGAKAVGEFHWVVDNFDPKFPVVIRGIDDHGATYWRVEEYAKQHARVPVLVKRKAASR